MWMIDILALVILRKYHIWELEVEEHNSWWPRAGGLGSAVRVYPGFICYHTSREQRRPSDFMRLL